MQSSEEKAVAIVGVGAILPDAPSAAAFWQNVVNQRYSISDVPPERWDPALYYDPDPKAADKTYTKLGGWVRGFEFDWKRFRMPPRVADAMDQGQQWAVTIAADALADYGYPERPLNTENTAVILGTAMGGELHYTTHQRIVFPEFAGALQQAGSFQQLAAPVREAILEEWHARIDSAHPTITEDSMPGELPNIVSGRVANILNLRGPNFITDAACASSFAAIKAAIEMLTEYEVDAVLTGGVDRNMGVSSFVKFCKIGALSATGSRPFGDGADGFVMGEGAAAFLLKRLEDAERSGDRIYAVIRGVGGASDGKGKGITAPNPVGQQLAVERAWETAGLDPATATLLEAHGTSTRVGDVVEVESLTAVFGKAPRGSIGLGSAKSNIGHLKAGAGAAGLLKATLAVHHKLLPPTLNAGTANPNIDFDSSPFYLLNEGRPWNPPNGTPRRAGVSAYGFGGTNFHVVLEEHVPGMLTEKKRTTVAVAKPQNGTATLSATAVPHHKPAPVRGILAIGADSPKALQDRLNQITERVETGWAPPRALLPDKADIQAKERLIIDWDTHAELLDRLQKAHKLMGFDNPQAWKAVEAQGIFRGSGKPGGKIAFLFPGQGSQYVNMGRELTELSPVVAEVFAEADEVMTPILGKPLTDYIFVDPDDQAAVNAAQWSLMQTEVTQPAMLTLDIAMLKLLAEYGFKPDMVMGHSLGEYAALIAAGIMPFAHALEAAAARGSEMSKVSVDDNGRMAAVLAPYDVIMATLAEIDGYVVPANVNSGSQCVIGGESAAVDAAVALFEERGYRAIPIPVSHAFHTRIVAPASGPLRQVLDRLSISEPQLPLVANVTGQLYPQTVDGIKDILQEQIASPVQWVKGLETLYREGVRTFVEVGPKRALRGFVRDVFADHDDVVALMTNHPKTGTLPTFNQALCGLYAAGYTGEETAEEPASIAPQPAAAPAPAKEAVMNNGQPPAPAATVPTADVLAQALAQVLQQSSATAVASKAFDRNNVPQGSVVISGTGLGLPGSEKSVMDPDNAMRILRGEQFVDLIPERFRKRMVAKNVTRLVKAADGSGSFETIDNVDDVIKLAGRPGSFDLEAEYGVPDKLIEALDITTQLAMAAGLDALREAGIPLVQTYRRTTTGKYLPDRWLLPEALRDETGVIFASAFPGGARFADEFKRYYEWQGRVEQLETLEDLRRFTTDGATLAELNRRITAVREEMVREPYIFDRRFLFRILCMGHSQFAQYIGARGPNAHVNAACASTAQGIALAEDWIRDGRCRRVIVIGADDVTGNDLMEWVGAGFLAVGAATTHDRVDEAALPFDRRRHGTILGMGACGLVVESEDAIRERGMRGIVELLSTETSNSAFHGTRLDVSHISQIMNSLVTAAERRFGLNRYAMASQTVFMSHETFTPARGGSASAEVVALRETFGPAADDIIVANTKGFTGHPMGVGVEDVIAVKILEHGIVPPVPNFKEVDPELGRLNLSRGGRYPVQYALHLAAGFGSQIAMTLTRRIPGAPNRIDSPGLYRRWLADISGYDQAETEVEKRVLRIKANGAPARTPVPSIWQPGTGPTVRVEMDGRSLPTAVAQPARMPIEAPPPAPPAKPTVQPAPEPVKVEAQPPVLAKPAAEPVVVKGAPQAPTTAVAPASAPVQPAAAPADTVAAQVLAIVAVQTGYPEDMLDLDLDMEADLGIDTVKQAETFLAIREAFDIPQRDDLNLRAFNTLEKVIGFVKEMRPDLAQAPASAAPQPTAVALAPAPAPAQPAGDAVLAQVLAIVAEQTGYPEDMLDLDLDMEADLGIDTVKQAETFLAIREAFDIPRRDDLNLRAFNTLEKVIGFVKEMRPDLAQAPASAAPQPTAVAPAPAPAPAMAPAPTPVADDDPIAAQVLTIVAEQTGYPEDMLDLDLDMEADLGIDTVKQAETFLAIRETFDIPRRDDLNLREFNTLEKVIGFVKEMRPDLVIQAPAATAVVAPGPTPDPTPTPAPAAAPVDSGDPVAAQVLAIVAEQTGYPEDMLELDLDMEADLGIDTVKQAETFLAIRETFDIPRRDDLNLREFNTLEKVIGFVKEMRPDLAAQAPPAATPTPAPAPATAAAPADSGDPVAAQVLAIVAAQTGYPEDMLELDLDMEADLGIDTVKQAETFLAIRETFDIPRRDDLNLRDYNTLEKVIGFVKEMRPELAARAGGAPQVETQATAPTPAQPTAAAAAVYALGDADSMPRRVPLPSLRPSLDICKPTGISLDAGSRVIVVSDEGGVGKALTGRLEKRGVGVLALDPTAEHAAIQSQIEAWLAGGAITGVYWLPALDVEPPLAELELADWKALTDGRVKKLYTTMRTLTGSINAPGTFLISATRLGGLHGYGPEGATAPLGGAVTGFTKAYKREQPEVLVKAVDFAVSRKTAALADQLIAETLTDPGVVEIGYADDQRFAITLVEQPVDASDSSVTLDGDTVFVVTGAAGGITSAIVTDLATASGGTFYLLDLVQAPERDDARIALFRSDKDALKQQLIADAKAAGERPTPAMIDRQLMAIERSEAALRAIESVEAAGGTAVYRSVNLLDGAAITAVVDEIRAQFGRIDVLIHAGGIEISRGLADKDFDQFSLVFDIKADGMFSLLKAAADMPLGASVVFSSVAGRFGNAGQTDYSAANDLLCKLTSNLKQARPGTRGIAIDWTAWGGIGMATRGSIPRIMEMAGIDMLPPQAGVPTVRRELLAGGGEIVVGGALGILVQEWDPTGGLDVAKANAWLKETLPDMLMVGELSAANLYGGLQATTTLDPNVQPFLYDHAMDGTPLLPGVMGTETFGEMARVLAPAYAVGGIANEQFQAPFKFYRMEPQTLHLSIWATPVANGDLVAHATLRSVRELARADMPPQVKTHFTAEVALTPTTAEMPRVTFTPPAGDAFDITAGAIYRIYFHGPAYQVLEGARVDGQRAIGLLAAGLPPSVEPGDTASLLAPRLVELCFQTAGVWDMQVNGRMALPLAIDSVTVYRQMEEAGDRRLYAIVEAVDGGEAYNAEVVDDEGNVYVSLDGYRTVALPGSVTLS